MADILISNESIQYINMAANILKIDVLDCIVSNDRLIFIVKKGHLGIAIGLKGKNLEKLRKLFKKNIKFVELDDDKEKFIKNLCKPYNINNLTIEGSGDSTIVKIEANASDKSKLIGKGGSNIDIIRKLANRHHSIKDVQIK